MIHDRAHENDAATMQRRLDELIAHARFAAALDLIAECQAKGPLPSEIEHSVTLARCPPKGRVAAVWRFDSVLLRLVCPRLLARI